MFILKQLVRDQVTFHNNRYGSAPDVIEILEEEFLDRVSVLFYVKFWGHLFVLAGSDQKFRSYAKGDTTAPQSKSLQTFWKCSKMFFS